MSKVTSGCVSWLKGLIKESREVSIYDNVVEVIERGSRSCRAPFRGAG